MPKELQKLIMANIQAQLASVQSDIGFSHRMIEQLKHDIKDHEKLLAEKMNRRHMLTKALIYIENHEVEE